MKALVVALMFLFAAPVSAAALLGPTRYLSNADSPIANLSGYDYFHLEDFENALFNAPDASVANPHGYRHASLLYGFRGYR